jgi:hypothetical protein
MTFAADYRSRGFSPVRGNGGPQRRTHGRECLRHQGRQKMRHEYEGESHDIVENKGQIFLSHDLYDK